MTDITDRSKRLFKNKVKKLPEYNVVHRRILTTERLTLITCYVMLHVMLCYVMLCYVMLCYVMLRYVLLPWVSDNECSDDLYQSGPLGDFFGNRNCSFPK